MTRNFNPCKNFENPIITTPFSSPFIFFSKSQKVKIERTKKTISICTFEDFLLLFLSSKNYAKKIITKLLSSYSSSSFFFLFILLRLVFSLSLDAMNPSYLHDFYGSPFLQKFPSSSFCYFLFIYRNHFHIKLDKVEMLHSKFLKKLLEQTTWGTPC